MPRNWSSFGSNVSPAPGAEGRPPQGVNDPGSGYDAEGNFVGTPEGAPMEGVEANPMIDPTDLAAGAFGKMMMGSKAGPLIEAVRASRAARTVGRVAPKVADDAVSSVAPTFGDAIVKGATPAAINASGESAASAEAVSRAAVEKVKQQLRFLVDTRTGHFKPIIPGVDAVDVTPGAHEVLLQVGIGKNPNMPTILDKGRNVTEAAIARLQRKMPQVHPDYQPPAAIPGLAAALGGGAAQAGAGGQAEPPPSQVKRANP